MDRDDQEDLGEDVEVWGQAPRGLEHHQPRVHQGGLFGEPPFRELCKWYDESYLSTKLATKTRDNTRSFIGQALMWLSAQGIEHPGPGDWVRYGNWRTSKECSIQISTTTWNTHRKRLAQVYTYCSACPRRGWLAVIPNPLHHSHVPPDREVRQRPRSLAEPYVTYPLLLAAMPDPRWRALVSLLRWNMLRIQEALAIPLPGSTFDGGRRLLDLDKGLLTIAKQRPADALRLEDLKTTYSAATIKLAPEPLRLLREAMEWKGKLDMAPTKQWRLSQGEASRCYVFPYFKNHLARTMDIHRRVAPADFPEWERAEQGAAAYHVYRHTGATEFMRNGGDKDTLHRLLRHASTKSTDAYIRALLVEVVDTDMVDQAWKAQEEKQAQATSERDGKGLKLVKPKETK